MAKAMVVWERAGEAWVPRGIFLGTRNRLDYRMLPGNATRDRWAAFAAANATPPLLPGSTTERGTWEDWILAAISDYSNAHDRWCTQVDPEATAEATFTKYVLEGSPVLTPEEFVGSDEIPSDLGGYRKVTPQ